MSPFSSYFIPIIFGFGDLTPLIVMVEWGVSFPNHCPNFTFDFKNIFTLNFPTIVICTLKNEGLVVGNSSTNPFDAYLSKWLNLPKMRDQALIQLVSLYDTQEGEINCVYSHLKIS